MTTDRLSGRIASLDIIRGAVMVLMALDHVRVYSGLPAGGPTPGIFFTRWVTNFCAPAFIFFAGTSAYLYGRKYPGLARFLVTRGAWLVFLELTVIRVGWTFNLDFSHYLLAGVIWAIGWCMILLAGLVKLPVRLVGAIGLAIIAGHNLVDGRFWDVASAVREGGAPWLGTILYFGFWTGPIHLGAGPTLYVLYSLIPWAGVMAAGYAFGAVMVMEPARRNRLCLQVGLSATALFLLLRGLNLYGDPFPWAAGAGAGGGGQPMPGWLAFLNTNKYPASLLFLLMTLGPTIALIPALERARGPVVRWLTVFGRVPMFFYLLHIPLVHALAVLVSLVRTPADTAWLFANHPMANPDPPAGYTWGLGLLYFWWVAAVGILYWPCRWFAGLKARTRSAWISYF
jgi:uncharacterized membrane protein